MRDAVRWLLVMACSIGLGFLFTYLGVPAAWILAAILPAGAMSLITQETLPMNQHVSRLGRNLIAVTAAIPITLTPASELARFILPGLVISIITVGIGLIGGLMLARSEKAISQETGILSMLAGGASVIPPLAQELGADFRYVTLTQYLRLLCVTISLPLLVPLMGFQADAVAPHQVHHFHWPSLLIIGLILAFAEPLGRKIHFPAPGIMTPLLITVGLGLLLPAPFDLMPPDPLKILAFLVIGWTAGGALSVPSLKLFARQLPATFLFIFVLLVACALSAFLLTWWLGMSYLEAYLASSPGGLETVLVLADESGAGPGVAAIQIIRLIAILLVAGYLKPVIKLIAR